MFPPRVNNFPSFPTATAVAPFPHENETNRNPKRHRFLEHFTTSHCLSFSFPRPLEVRCDSAAAYGEKYSNFHPQPHQDMETETQSIVIDCETWLWRQARSEKILLQLSMPSLVVAVQKLQLDFRFGHERAKHSGEIWWNGLYVRLPSGYKLRVWTDLNIDIWFYRCYCWNCSLAK